MPPFFCWCGAAQRTDADATADSRQYTMSFRVTERTFAHTTQRGSFLAALLFLADRADEHGVSWYGVAKIAAAINLSKRQTRHILSTLRDRGEIWYAARFWHDGAQTSNGYVVCCGLSLKEIHAALHHSQLELSEAAIEAAVRAIAEARGEPVPDDGWRTAEAEAPAADGAALVPAAGDGPRTADAEVALAGGAALVLAAVAARMPANGSQAQPAHGARAAAAVAVGEPYALESADDGLPRVDRQWATARGADWALSVGSVSHRAAGDGGETDVDRRLPAGEPRPPPNGAPDVIDADALWQEVLSDLACSMPEEVFRAHFLATSADWDGEAPRLARDALVRDALVQDALAGDGASQPLGQPPTLQVQARAVSVPWLVKRYRERVERYVADHAGQPVTVTFVSRAGMPASQP